MMQIPTEIIVRHEDERGGLVKAWTAPVEGEVYVVEITPGASRGHHIHERGAEWFVPLVGQPLLVVEDPITGERASVRLDGVRAKVAAGLAHALFADQDQKVMVMAVAELRPEQDRTRPHPVKAP